MLRTLISFLLALLLAFPAFGGSKPRPYTGIGMLIVRSFTPTQAADKVTIPVYEDPGVGRLIDIAGKELPQLAPVINRVDGEYTVAVMGKKRDWLRIAYDDAGREGWVHKERYWEYTPWEDCLKGRTARLLPGLKQGLYNLRKGPSETSQIQETLSRAACVRIVEIRDDWCLAMIEPEVAGWLRWRDIDGRFLIAVEK